MHDSNLSGSEQKPFNKTVVHILLEEDALVLHARLVAAQITKEKQNGVCVCLCLRIS